MQDEILEKIKAAKTITIFGHVLPDGDCYGSQIGLKEAIRATFKDKEVFILGSGIPRLFDRYGAMDEVSDEVIANSLALILDVANFERIEDQRYAMAYDKVKIDHHIYANTYGSVEWIDNSAASCSQMIAEFVKENNLAISPLGAEVLLLGLVTDSGRFQYSSTTSKSFDIASYLLLKGANLKELYDNLYVVEEKDLKYKGFVYSNYQLKEGVAYLKIPYSTCVKYEITPDYAASMVNMIADIKGYPIWATFAESENGIVRVELRSSGIPIQPIAVKYGGGGHLQASGCRLESMDMANDVINDLIQLVKENK